MRTCGRRPDDDCTPSGGTELSFLTASEASRPAALLLHGFPSAARGRHDAFFDLAEVLSWMQDLPRMEAHIFDAGHMLLETHAPAAAALMLDFLRRARPDRRSAGASR